MRLSILICSLNNRKDKLDKLLAILDKQKSGFVEILVNSDDGNLRIGEKRNILLENAKGEYVCFIDDDDIVPDYYVEEILKALQGTPDAVGFMADIEFKNGRTALVLYDHGNEDIQGNGIYYRGIWHLQPVKRELALRAKFPGLKNRGEDADYANALRPLIKTCVFINKKMYHYYANYNG